MKKYEITTKIPPNRGVVNYANSPNEVKVLLEYGDIVVVKFVELNNITLTTIDGIEPTPLTEEPKNCFWSVDLN